MLGLGEELDQLEQFEEIFGERVLVLEEEEKQLLGELSVSSELVLDHELPDVLWRVAILNHGHDLLQLLASWLRVFLLLVVVQRVGLLFDLEVVIYLAVLFSHPSESGLENLRDEIWDVVEG